MDDDETIPSWHDEAREAFLEALRITGSQCALAQICPCTQGNISQLVRRGSLLPAHFALNVEAATGVSRHRLRPDIFGRPEAAPADLAQDENGVVRDQQPQTQKKDMPDA